MKHFTTQEEKEMDKLTTSEDFTRARNFSKKLSGVYEEIEKELEAWLPNLKIYVSPQGEISLWSKRGHGIHTPFDTPINVGGMMLHETRWLVWVNKEIEKVNNEPDEYFWCTTCGKVQPKENYKASVFAGYYCKDCYDNDEAIQRLVKHSNEPGFYD